MTDVQSNQKRDLVFIGILVVITYIFSGYFDLQDRVDRFCELYERFEADEIMFVGLLLIPVSMLYFWRRWQEIREANRRLGAALAEIDHLRGIIPICCSCKKIRDDDGYWHEVETYFKAHLDTSFTHGICDDCIQKNYPEQHAKMMKERQGTTNPND